MARQKDTDPGPKTFTSPCRGLPSIESVRMDTEAEVETALGVHPPKMSTYVDGNDLKPLGTEFR